MLFQFIFFLMLDAKFFKINLLLNKFQIILIHCRYFRIEGWNILYYQYSFAIKAVEIFLSHENSKTIFKTYLHGKSEQKNNNIFYYYLALLKSINSVF